MKKGAWAFLLAFAAISGPAFAATKIWTGAAKTLQFSDPGNWQDGLTPVAGDRAVFGPSGTGSLILVDTAGVSLDGIDFVDGGQVTGIGGAAITLTGNTPVTVTSHFTYSIASDITFSATNPTLQIIGPGRLQIVTGFHTMWAGGTVNLVGPGDAVFDFEADIGEMAPTTFRTSASIYFSGNNSFSGGVNANGGEILSNGGVPPFGAPSASVSLSGLSFLEVFSRPNTTIANPLLFSQTTSVSGQTTVLHLSNGMAGVVHYTGSIDMETDQVFGIMPPGDVTFNGPISGPGHMTLQASSGSGVATYHLANPSNSFTGGLEVDHVTLVAEANSAIPPQGPVALGAGALLQLGSTTQSVESFSCDGGGALALVAGVAALNVAGQVTLGNCALIVAGPTPGVGTLIHSGAPVIGQFANLPEGALVGGLFITYHGGASGHDVVLVTPPAGVGEVQDMWWAGPSENGWGMSLIQHDDRLFAALFIYDASGNPTWVAMLGGSWNSTHTAFTGPLYETTGSPYYAYDSTHFAAGASKGSLTITFQDVNNATLDYNVGSSVGHKVITRELFGAGALPGIDHTDLWWGGLSQNGWGITIMQQDATLFPIWFTYGANGAPAWYFMAGAWNATGTTYSGIMYRATGSPWIGATYDPSKLDVMDAGTFSIAFTASNAATFTYSVDGHSGTMPLSREPF